jgi:hypothetical protein
MLNGNSAIYHRPLRLFVLEFYRTQLSHGKAARDGTHEVINYTAPIFS